MSIKADNRVLIEVRKHYGDKTKRKFIWVTEELLENIGSKEVLISLLGTKVLEGIKEVRD